MLSAGTYTLTAPLNITGLRTLIGDGSPRPIVTSSAVGPILTLDPLSDVTLDHLRISGATVDTINSKYAAIECYTDYNEFSRALRVIDADISDNGGQGIDGASCSLTAIRSTFRNNKGGAIGSRDSVSTVDRCVFEGNQGYGLFLDGGMMNVTNSFLVRNTHGLSIFPTSPGAQVAFNTVVSNTEDGISCGPFQGGTAQLPNNIVAGNASNSVGGVDCDFTGTIVMDDIGPLHFVQPDVAPYDYHIISGSVAIDAAMESTVDHDFDGDARPKGKGRDVGADEAQ